MCSGQQICKTFEKDGTEYLQKYMQGNVSNDCLLLDLGGWEEGVEIYFSPRAFVLLDFKKPIYT